MLLGVLLSQSACAEISVEQGLVDNEDPHPHEIFPGKVGIFSIPSAGHRLRVYVRCVLNGPAGPIKLIFQNFKPSGWAAEVSSFTLNNSPLEVDILGETEVQGKVASYFAFANDDPKRILWHQCYNRNADEQ